MGKRNRSRLSALLCALLLLGTLSGCGAKPTPAPDAAEDVRTQSLEKLCLVWGYAKYRHPVFLWGRKDWDAELLALVGPISEAESGDKANAILYDWFVSLGILDYGTTIPEPVWSAAAEGDRLFFADTAWVSDAAYLGERLSAGLSRLGEIPDVYRGEAPVRFDAAGNPSFSNEKTYEDMDYADAGYRLLALFRLWNAVEYCSPCRDTLDDWRALLAEYIPAMLAGSDRASYARTLTALLVRLNDTYALSSFTEPLLLTDSGVYGAPVRLSRAEGRWVVESADAERGADCPLRRGDVLLRLNGEDIDAVTERLKKDVSLTDGQKLLGLLGRFVLRAPEPQMEVAVLRGGAEQTLTVQGVENYVSPWRAAARSHELLEGSIGLISPSAMADGELGSIMAAFADTRGLILDLRQEIPSSVGQETFLKALSGYVLAQAEPFATFRVPSKAVPGAFLLSAPERAGGGRTETYPGPVVVLMNEETTGLAEYILLSLRNSPRVTLLGERSGGTSMSMVSLPLPDGGAAILTGVGFCTAEGVPLRPDGLTPDVEAHPTVAGIRDGRDELLEAAVQLILKQ